MVVIKNYAPIEVEIQNRKTKTRSKILERQSNANSFKSWLESSITLLRTDKRYEEEQMLKTILNKYLQFNKPIKQELKQEYGKSFFEYKVFPEIIETVTYRKGEPFKIELAVKDVDYIEDKIKFFLKNKESIQSKVIALYWARDMEKKELTWKEFFSDRKYHNYFTTCLRYLREVELINYKGGVISLK